MTTAFVLAGGASLGAVQAGMAEVLLGSGIQPDLFVGASVGAINGTWLASHPGVEGALSLQELWRSIRRRDVFPVSPRCLVGGVVGRCDHLVSAGHLTRWLTERAPFARVEDAPLPLHVVATDLLSGQPVVLSEGDLVQALLASSAIPGVFPPVEIDGRVLVDGGLAADTPISQAVDLGADVVYVLSTVGNLAGGRPRGALGVSMRAVAHLLGHASLSQIRANASRCTLYLVAPPPPIDVSPFDFRQSEALIERGRESASSWLGSCEPVPATL
ncbi:MAG: patatin-like phospholipase family protein [Acidimicrobiales bacterium]